MQCHSVTSLETARSLTNGPSWGGGGGAEGEICILHSPGELQRLLSLFCLWAELNGGKNFIHWKANMLPLFSIMTLWLVLPPLIKDIVSYSTRGC